MNIEQAKQIPLSLIVEHLGGRFSRKGRNGELWYFSPFRPKERTASFKIDEKTNRWHDFGHVSQASISGDPISLWCEFHGLDRKTQVKEALKALRAFSGTHSVISHHQVQKSRFKQQTDDIATPEPPRFKVLTIHKNIYFPKLKEELQRRRISLDVANRYLKQIYLEDTENPNWKANGFAFPNDKGGYEISIPFAGQEKSFKTSIRPKGLTLIEGNDKTRALVFEGLWDFLSYLEMNKITVPPHDAYILNSLSFCGEVIDNIGKRKEDLELVLLYLDNDEAGFQAMHIMTGELATLGLAVGSMESGYQGFKDLNDWWMQRRLV